MSLRLKITAVPGPVPAMRSIIGAVVVGAVLLLLLAPPVSAQSSEVRVEKSTNGEDADTGTGPILAPGTAVDWRYVITATGSTPLYDLIVSDSSGVVPDCDINGDGNFDGTHIHPGPLAGGQSFVCGARGTVHGAGNGTFAASGRVKAFDFSGDAHFEDDDPSHYTPLIPFKADPKVTIQSLVNGSDADSSPGPYVAEGSPVVMSYVVTNTGNVPLSSITVSDTRGVAVDCGPSGRTIQGLLAPGASITCSGSSSAVTMATGLQAGSATVEATAVDPTNGGSLGRLEATDRLHYTPVQLPGTLAFTGPSTAYAAAGAVSALAGTALLLFGSLSTRAARRRSEGREVATAG